MLITIKFAVLILLLLIPACSSKKVAPESIVSGEIFITTKGRDTIRLSAATVALFPLLDMEKHLDAKRGEDANKSKDWEFYLGGLPDPPYRTTTDSNGKFSLTVKPGQYAVLVLDSRKVIMHDESYQWLVRIDAMKNVNVTLDNNNLNGTLGSMLPMYSR